jgi:hypothetical protein
MNKIHIIIPWDIIINHIIPYTYELQQKLLLEDIQNFHIIKKELMNEKYDIYIIKCDILNIFYDFHTPLMNIIKRHFIPITLNQIYSCSVDKMFSLLFGLFIPKERTQFLQYIRQDEIWFLHH